MGVCVCIHTHTHTLRVGYSDVSPGVGTRHLEGPKNPDELNHGMYVFVYVYIVHMSTYLYSYMCTFFYVYVRRREFFLGLTAFSFNIFCIRICVHSTRLNIYAGSL